jgi:hypothetical protein
MMEGIIQGMMDWGIRGTQYATPDPVAGFNNEVQHFGQRRPAGVIYFVRLETPNYHETGKVYLTH